jgi:hypothetical protein
MADDYYSAPESASASPGDVGDVKPSKPQGDNEDEMEGNTALVPKSIFGSKIPDVGQECRFKCQHIWENEVELSWEKDGDENGPSKGKRSTMDDVDDTFDKMAEPAATEE